MRKLDDYAGAGLSPEALSLTCCFGRKALDVAHELSFCQTQGRGTNMGRPVGARGKAPIGVNGAAEFLYAIFDEFKAADEAASIAMTEARVLLGLCVSRAIDAHACNMTAKGKSR